MTALRVFGALALCGIAARAQDTRHVTEPVIPSSCTVLESKLPAKLTDADEDRSDTARIQDALDHCGAGKAVELKSGSFLSGPLQLRTGVTLVLDSGAVLFASRNPRVFDMQPNGCAIVNKAGHGCRALINGEHVANAGVMGDGLIDGRGPATLLGEKVSWWDLAQEAKVTNLNQNCPRLIVLSHCDNFTLYRIRMKDSPNFHVSYNGGNGFTAWGVIIDTGKAGRNTDGIDPGNCSNVTITHCYIRAGDDNVAIKAGMPGPTKNITIAHNHFYYGHGMSIGSETDGGASAIRVTDLSIEGADNGIRIKSNSSRGGLVRDVVYEDVCIKDTTNPIYMDSNYSYRGEATDKLPQFQDITLRNVRIIGAGKITLDGFDATHKLGMIFDNLHFDSPASIKMKADHGAFQLGPGPVNFVPAGEDIQMMQASGKGSPNACTDKFVPLPK